MWPIVLRKGIPALIALTLVSAFLPDAARAAGGFDAGAGFVAGHTGPRMALRPWACVLVSAMAISVIC